MKNSTTNYLRLIEVILLICSFAMTKRNHPKHLKALNSNYSQGKGTSQISVPALWCKTGPWAVNAPQHSLQHNCISKAISSEGLGEARPLCKEKKRNQKHRVHPEAEPRGEPWAPQGGDIHSLSKWLNLNEPKRPGLAHVSRCSLGFGCPIQH